MVKKSKKCLFAYFLYILAILYCCYTLYMMVSTYHLVIQTYAGYGITPETSQLILNVLANAVSPLFYSVVLFALGKIMEFLHDNLPVLKKEENQKETAQAQIVEESDADKEESAEVITEEPAEIITEEPVEEIVSEN